MTTYKYKGFSSGFSVASDLIWQTCYPVLPTSVHICGKCAVLYSHKCLTKVEGATSRSITIICIVLLITHTHIITFCGDIWNVGVYQLDSSSHTKGLVTRLGCPHANEPDCFCEWSKMSWSNLTWPDLIPYRGKESGTWPQNSLLPTPRSVYQS